MHVYPTTYQPAPSLQEFKRLAEAEITVWKEKGCQASVHELYRHLKGLASSYAMDQLQYMEMKRFIANELFT